MANSRSICNIPISLVTERVLCPLRAEHTKPVPSVRGSTSSLPQRHATALRTMPPLSALQSSPPTGFCSLGSLLSSSRCLLLPGSPTQITQVSEALGKASAQCGLVRSRSPGVKTEHLGCNSLHSHRLQGPRQLGRRSVRCAGGPLPGEAGSCHCTKAFLRDFLWLRTHT